MATLSVRVFAHQTGQTGTAGAPLSVRRIAKALLEPGPVSLRHMMQFPSAPRQLLPTGQPATLLNVTLSWQDAAAGTYRAATAFIVSSSDLEIDTPVTIPAPANLYQVPGVLDYSREYIWAVSAMNEAGESGSASASFAALAPTPEHLVPATGTVDVQVNPTLSWIDPGVALGSPATSFQVTITSLYDIRKQTYVVGTTSIAIPETLLFASVYEWSVAGAYGKSPFYGLLSSATFTTIASG